MYATKTKKIASYGRRGQRVVPAHDDHQPLRPKIPEDRGTERSTKLGVFSQCSPASSRTDRENFGSLDSSPMNRNQASMGFDSVFAKRTKILGPMKSNRKILGDYPTNAPGSPAISPKRSAKYRLVGKGTPIARRPFSPYMDVEIVVNDEHGRRLSQEKRILKPEVQVNLIGTSAVQRVEKRMPKDAKKSLHPMTSTRARRRSSVISLSSGSSEDEYVPRQAKMSKAPQKFINGTKKAKSHPIVNSDSEESNSDFNTQELLKPSSTRKCRNRAIVVSSDSDNSPRLQSLTDFAKSGNRIGSPDRFTRNSQNANSSVSKFVSSNTKERSNTTPIEVLVPRLSTTSVLSYIPLEQYEKQFAATCGKFPTHNTPSAQTPLSSPKSLPRKTNHSPRPITVTPHPSFARIKPRRATPFRGSQVRPFFQHTHNIVPSTPSEMETDLDDTLQEIEKMMLSVSLQASLSMQQSYLPEYAVKGCHSKEDKLISQQQITHLCSSDLASPTYLRPLLSECDQQAPYDFEEFIETFPVEYAHLLSEPESHSGKSAKARTKPNFNKIGEASYSEVFGIGNIVLKIIPLRDEEESQASSFSADVADEPFLSDAKDVLKEIIVTRSMGETCPGFIRLLSVHVVKGKYPASLLSLWDEYNERKGSEGVRPETFGTSQNYIVIILPNGGPDLEALSFTTSSPKSGWRQACSIFWQITRSLSMAEELVEFEHRDLHWGQILVKQQANSSSTRKKSNVKGNADVSITQESTKFFMDDLAHGVQATIIDFGLARIDKVTKEKESSETAYWTIFDPMIFEGEGDYQFDVYRMMKEHNGNSWEEYRPLTNVMWLHYLSLKLLHAKRLRIPISRSNRKNVTVNNSTVQEMELRCYKCLVEVEKKLAKVLSKVPRRQIKSDIKGSDTTLGFNCAGDVLLFGQSKGWVK